MSNPILTARILNCSFSPHDGRTYAYFTDDETIQAGDLVVVVAPQSRDGNAYPIFEVGSPSVSAPVAPEAPNGGWATPVAPPPPPAPAGVVGYPKIVRVVSTEETVESVERVREWIVCKLDFSEYRERRATEERRKVLTAKIKRATQEARERLELDELASKSPELKALLEEAAKLR